jgi:endonuclease-3
VRTLYARLAEAFGVPERAAPGTSDAPDAPDAPDPLERVVRALISQHTSGPNSRRAYAALRERFPTWEDVRDASPEAIAASIRTAGLARQKAPRLKALLIRLAAERGALDLRFLGALSDAAAMAWLRHLPGIGQTTAACTLLFGLGRPVMPVDGGILRVTRRLGLVPPTGTPDDVQRVLEAGIEGEAIYALHLNLIRFAREICAPRAPACPICPLNDRCVYFRTGGAR